MKTLEYRTEDKSEWGDGPWQGEPDKRQWQDPETGLPCLIVRNRLGALCGYVGVSKGHPAYEKHYDAVDVSVHGGLTFSNKCSPGDESQSICHLVESGEDDDVWWLGFDCAHFQDYSPGMDSRLPAYLRDEHDFHNVYRDFPYVEREVTRLAKQLSKQTP